MPLVPGSKLGPYEVVSPLGAGGMGEVYRARDKRLDRTVAIKILPEHLSRDPVRRQRFEREAKSISGLNHPNICTLHDIGSQDGIDYLVMECVEGETLAERLQKGPLPVELVVKIGREIADALDKAHRSGIVHRDLKPGNIMLTKSGSKLLDFGLARSASKTASLGTVTATASPQSTVTEDGTVVGTFRYMSPEQVEGKELDARSDIFSLGAVLYEMVTGQRAFEGKSQLSVASAILEKEPAPINSLKPMTPPALDHAIRRSLAKDPDERWQTARDLALELKWISGEGSGVDAPQVASRIKGERLPWALVAVALVASAVAVLAYLRAANAPQPVIVADVSPPKGTRFAFLVNGPPALSPDGHSVVFSAYDASGTSLLWVRSFDGSPARSLPGTEDSARPFWSPDSRMIGFYSHRKLQAIEASGGPPTVVTELLGIGGATWSREGTILFAQGGRIHQVPASGGTPIPVLRPDASKFAFIFEPRFLPDGKHFLYQAANPGSQGDTYFASLDGKVNRSLVQGSGRAVYGSGFLVYCRGTTLIAEPFDPERGELTGTPRPIAEPVGGSAFESYFDASENGVVIYEPSTQAASETQLAWFDRSGKKLASIGPPAVHYDIRFSRDARKLASSAGNPKSEIWVDDIGRGVRMRLTFDPETDKGIPVWSVDGNRMLYSTLRGGKATIGIYQKASNGTGGEELLLASDKANQETWATDWSRDGRFVLFCRGEMANSSESEVWVLPLVGEKKPNLFLHTPGAAFDAQFSPDGRWVAYTSTESGKPQVYVAPFEAAKFSNGTRASSVAGGKWQISSDGGSVPRWRADGKELFYLGPQNTLMAAQVEGKGAGFEVGRSQPLFAAPLSPFAVTYDATPDGKRFVLAVAPEEENLPLAVVFNWPARLRVK